MAHVQPDFELNITPTEVEVLNSPVGSGLRTPFKLPFTPHKLQELSVYFAPDMVTGNSPSISQASLVRREVGQRLFGSLFADENVRWLYEHSRTSENGLRLKLHIDEALASYPWELLHDPNDNSFTVDPKLSVVRYQSTPIPSTPLPLSGPLRILIAAGYSPNEQLAEKIEQLHASLAPLEKNGLLQIVVLKKASLSAIHQSLRRHRFHVLHYFGHCLVTTSNQPSKLCFWNKGLDSESWVEPLRLWRILSQTGTVRLLWLNSCSKMSDAITLPLQGTARSLVQAGLPAVIANRLHSHEQTPLLSCGFYKRLANGLPVDRSLAMARHTISSTSRNRHQWTIPMLFTHTQNGVLFTKPPAPFAKKAIGAVAQREQAQVSLSIPTLPLTLSQSALYSQASFLEEATDAGEKATILPPIEQKQGSDKKIRHFLEPWPKQTLKILRTVLNLIAMLLTIFLLLGNY